MKKLLLITSAAVATLAAATSAFAEDAYIESAGVTGMDTEYHLKPTSRIELDFQLTELEQTNAARLFGTDYNASALKTGCSIYISNQYLVYGFIANGSWSTLWMKDSGGNYILHDTDRHLAVFDFPGRRDRYETAGSVTASGNDPLAGKYKDESTGTLALFANKTATGFDKPAKVRIFGMKIYESDELVHDFQPCVTDGLAGFRDSVTGKFIAGGTKPNSFTAGGDYPTYESPYVATPSDNNAYYIDTEYQASANTCFMLDCAPLGTWTSGMSAWYLFYGYGSKPFSGYISGQGYGTQNLSAWDTGVVPLADLEPGVRRTFALDNFNQKSFALVAGTTNGTVKTISASTESHPANTITVKIASSFRGDNNYVPMKVYGCKIYESGELVRDFEPYVRDGYPGLRDKLTGLFVTYPQNKKREAAAVLSAGGEGLLVEADPYIEGSGANGPYIVTDYKPCGNTRAEIDFAQTSFDTAVTHYPFSIHGGGDNFLFAIYAFTNGRWGNICQDNSAVWTHDVSKSPTQTLARVRLILDAKNSKYIAADAGVTNAIYTIDKGTRTGSNRATHYLPIFATHDFAAASRMPMKLYSFKIYEDDVLVRDYVPAVSNGVAGLQDQLPGGKFLAPATGAFTYGGAFPVEASQDKQKLSARQTATLTASAPGATSYRWLKNGEPIEGGANGTLTVAWRKPKSNPTDGYQAVARYTSDGLTAESKPSAAVTIENLPLGTIFSVR